MPLSRAIDVLALECAPPGAAVWLRPICRNCYPTAVAGEASIEFTFAIRVRAC